MKTLRGAFSVKYALLLGLAGLAACNMAPPYKTPAHDDPARWDAPHRLSAAPAPIGGSRPTTQPIDPAWWRIFHDPMLTSLEQQMVAENLDLRTQAYRLAESRQQVEITTAQSFPQVSGTGSYDRIRLSPKGEFGLISGGSSGGGAANAGLPASDLGGLGSQIGQPFNLWQYGFDANWELDLWGRIRNSIKEAKYNLDATEEDRRNMLVSMLAETARVYLELRNTQAQLTIAGNNLKLAQESADLAQQRVTAGLSNGLDLANAQAQLADTNAMVPPLEQRQSQQINQLSFLLGRPPGALSELLETAHPLPPLPPEIPIGMPSELVQRRPDIRQADDRLRVALAAIGVARANFYPSVVLSANITLQALHFKDLGNWDSRTYTMGPNITLPIFEGGKLVAQLKLAKVTEQEAAIAYRRTVLNAFHEVDNALIAYHAEQQHRDQLMMEGARDREAMQLSRDRYRSGLTTFIDVLNTERQLLRAEQALQDSNATICTNLVQLYLALGGGWDADFTQSADASDAAPATGPLPALLTP